MKWPLSNCLLMLLASTGLASEPQHPVSFVNDVVPILTKAGCNSGSCHAKAGMGQNGFRLSLLGFEPDEDYEHIVREGHGRRVFPLAPDQSLLLLKASNSIPHGGGRRLPPDSTSYQVIARWIQQGMPYAKQSDPQLVSLSVDPPQSDLKPHAQIQLEVTAGYSDGSRRDVTETALFESNDASMAEVNEAGRVTIQDRPGNVAIMVRFQGLVAVSSAAIPLGAPVENLPAAKNFIDELVFKNLKRIGIPPSPVCDDSTFLRRVTLDIAGRLPTIEETKSFLASTQIDKRDALVTALLASPEYADYFANKWSALLKNRRDAASDKTANFAFHSWVRDSLLANKPYDQIVRELLGATGDVVGNPPVAWYKRVKEPEQQLEDVAQLFLGVRMHCAHCHHHPFERWSQQDYYGLAAFFTQIGRRPTATAGEDIIFHKRGLAHAENKKTGQPVKPTPLGAPALEIGPDDDPRLKLADWMSDPENPFFAQALVNRYWKHFFKRGLIEPEDDVRDSNPPTNPELLDALAQHFIRSGFDLKDLIRVITQSNTYQLSAAPNENNKIDQQNYSRFYPKHLSAEVLLDAIDRLTGAQTSFADLPMGTHAVALPDNSYNKSSQFLTVFGRPDGASSCECERVDSPSLAQSMLLMNASGIKQKLSTSSGRADVLSRSKLPVEENIREIYLTAFSRLPEPEELQTVESFLAKPRLNAKGEPLDAQTSLRQRYEDLLWAILNTKEFLYNH